MFHYIRKISTETSVVSCHAQEATEFSLSEVRENYDGTDFGFYRSYGTLANIFSLIFNSIMTEFTFGEVQS